MNEAAKQAVLIRLSIPMYAGERTSKELSKEIAKTHGMDEESVQSKIRALRPETRAKIVAAKNKIRSIWVGSTLPWMDEGTRICPVAKYAKTREAMEAAAIEFEEATRELVEKYDEIKADAKARLNGMFDEVGFPSREEFARRFRCHIGIGLVNTAADVRLEILGDEQIAKLKAELEEQVKGQMALSQRDALIQVGKSISKLVEKLAEVDAPKGEEDKTRYFKNSIVTNIVEIAEEMRGMNIIQSPRLDKFLKSIKTRFAKIDPDTMREQKEVREEAAKLGREALSELDEFVF